jgi:hypothetical protein
MKQIAGTAVKPRVNYDSSRTSSDSWWHQATASMCGESAGEFDRAKQVYVVGANEALFRDDKPGSGC